MSTLSALDSSKLHFVGHNLGNIYSALHDTKKNKEITSLLVPSLFSKDSIYHANKGWQGRTLSLIYAGIGLLFGDNFKTQRLNQALEKTQKAFNELYQDLVPHLDHYEKEDLFNQKTQEIPNITEADHLSRNQIIQFYEALHPYIKLFRHAILTTKEERKLKTFDTPKNVKAQEKVLKRVREFSCKHLKILKTVDRKELKITLDRFYSYLAIMRLQGHLKKDPSHPSIHRLCAAIKWKRLPHEKDSDFQGLQNWVENLKNSPKTKFNIRLFHKGLKALAKERTQAFERFLAKELRFEEFKTRVDKKHEQWRKSRQKGDVFYYQLEREIKKGFLGKELIGNLKEGTPDQHRIFEIEDENHQRNPDFVLKIALNRAVLPLRKEIWQECYHIIPPAKTEYLSPNGRFALMEKLSEPTLEQYEETLTNLIRQCTESRTTPTNLSKRNFLLNSQGALKVIHGNSEDTFCNVMALESLVYECLAKNLEMYSKVIAPLLDQNPEMNNYFKKVIKSAVMGNDSPRTIMLKYKFENASLLIERAEKLHDKTLKFKEKYKEEYKTTDYSKLLSAVLDQYDASGAFGRFTFNFRSLTISGSEKKQDE